MNKNQKMEDNISQIRKTRINNLTNHELLTGVKETERLPLKLSHPVSLGQMVHFYNRYWNNDLSEESGTSSDGVF